MVAALDWCSHATHDRIWLVVGLVVVLGLMAL